MADDIQYNYQALDSAADMLQRNHTQFNDICDRLEAEARAAFGTNSGPSVDAYNQVANDLNQKQTTLNEEFGKRIGDFRVACEDMAQTDKSAAAAFS